MQRSLTYLIRVSVENIIKTLIVLVVINDYIVTAGEKVKRQ